MLFTNVIKDYFIWHYSTAIKELVHIWKNFLWFTLHLFSVPRLIKTWVSPWKRIHEERTRAWNFEDFIGSLFISLLSRLIGFFIRTVFIVVGCLLILLTFTLGLCLILTWFLLPVLPISLMVIGIAVLVT